MPYDPTVDKQVFNKSWENETGKINVSVYSYNQGTPKLQIARENYNRDGELKFAKLGRMTKEEVEAILPHIKEAVDHL